MGKEIFHPHEIVEVMNVEPMPGNTVAPPLRKGAALPIVSICLDSQGNQHINVGLASKYEFIRSHETKEELPNGDTIHWCHSSRFRKL